MKEKIACFICLIDISRPKKIDLPCECKPYLHQRCLNNWFKNCINECPLCRTNYEEYGIEQAQVVVPINNNINRITKKVILIFIICGIIFNILTLILTIISYF
jgi:hypothetical protein